MIQKDVVLTVGLLFALVITALSLSACNNDAVSQLAKEKGELQAKVDSLEMQKKSLKGENSRLKESLESLQGQSKSVKDALKKDLDDCRATVASITSHGPKPPSFGVRVVIATLNGLTHVFILAILGLLVYLLYTVIMAANSDLEKFIRTVAVVNGFLVYFGARAGGMSIPMMLSEAFSSVSFVSSGVVGVALPSTIGALTAWQFKRAIKKSKTSNIPTRIILLISTFIVVLFTECYIDSQQAATEAPLHLYLVPNVAFIVGFALYVILRWDLEDFWRESFDPSTAPDGRRGFSRFRR